MGISYQGLGRAQLHITFVTVIEPPISILDRVLMPARWWGCVGRTWPCKAFVLTRFLHFYSTTLCTLTCFLPSECISLALFLPLQDGYAGSQGGGKYSYRGVGN